MKKLITLMTLLLAVNFAFAQDADDPMFAKKFFIGGSLNVNNISFDNDADNQFSFASSLVFGRQLSHKTQAGIRLNYNHNPIYLTIVDRLILNSFDSDEFGVNVFARFLITAGVKLHFLVEPYVGYSTASGQSSIYSVGGGWVENLDVNSFTVGVLPRIMYNINDTWRLSTSIGGISYRNSNYDYEQTNAADFKSNTFNANFSISNIYLGAEYRF